jgi:putative transposase
MEGWKVNHKRVQRLWRAEGLRVPPHSPKRRRLGTSTVPACRLQAERPNQVWALDFMFDTTADGRPFKVLSMCDEFTRESVGGLLGRSITADAVVEELDRLRLQRGAPGYIRCDNGPEFVAQAIRDWCRFCGTGTSFIDPGSPWQNPTWRASTAGPETSSSPARSSTQSSRPRSSTRTGATPTISTVPTVR